MRKNKTVLAAGALAFATMLYVGLQLTPKGSKNAYLGKPLLAPSRISELTGIRLEDGKTVLEMRRNSRNEWVLPKDSDFPINAHRVSALLDYLTQQKITQQVATDPRDLAEVGLQNPMKITLSSNQGPILTIGLGSMRRGHGQFIFVENSTNVFLNEFTQELKADPEEWAQRDLWQIPEEKVRSVSVTFPATPNREPVIVARENEHSEWKANGLPKNKPMLNHLRIGLVDLARNTGFHKRALQSTFNPPLNRTADIRMDIQTFDDAHYALEVYRLPKKEKEQGTPAWARARLVNRSVASTLPSDVEPFPHWKNWYFYFESGLFDNLNIRPIDLAVPRKSN